MQSEFRAYNVRLVSKRHIRLCLMKSVVKVVIFYEETVADWFAKLEYLYHTETAYNEKKFWSVGVLLQTHFTIIP